MKAKTSLPTGTVTLLFTDIVGSSRLWEQHGDRFIPVWQAHDAIVRDAITRFGGHEIKSEGDSFMAAFADPAAALHCACFAQTSLARYPWPADIDAPRVRMGLHTGEPLLHRNDYFGPAVNRAANICGAAHGGDILLSDETRQAFDGSLDGRIEFTDLGDHRLKDMSAATRLYRAQHPSMEIRNFPPPRTLEGQPNNLPIQRTSFVGRAKEIEQVAAYLAEGKKPLLTLIGPGGIGKTRLSLQAAAQKAEWFPDGVWYIRLVEARDVVGAAVEIASAMNIPLRPDEPTLPQVRDWLADRRCLLILDDANTLPQADRLIRELLSGSTSLRCLATARESLQIADADELHVTGLSTSPEAAEAGKERDTTDGQAVAEQAPAASAPTPAGTPLLSNRAQAEQAEKHLAMTEAGRLFLDRALAVNPDLNLTASEVAAVQLLLQELEGVPVSIERAAQMMDRVPPSVVLEWLNQHLREERVPAVKTPGVEKFKGLLRKSAQKVDSAVREAPRALASLGQLMQTVASIATDRHDAQQAGQLGRESLRLSQEAGDITGLATALRQLARVKWQQGDRQSAVAMLSVAVQLYQQQGATETGEVQRELERARELLGQTAPSLPVTPSVENAISLALEETA